MIIQAGTIQKMRYVEDDGSRFRFENEDVTVLLNASDIQEELTHGDERELFLYVDRRGELTGTTFLPEMTVGEYGWATVLRQDDEGVYVDIGSTIEVLVDRGDLPRLRKLWPDVGDRLFMTLRTDGGGTLFARLATETVVQEMIDEADATLHNADLQARPYRLLPVGTFLLTEGRKMYRIFVHESERKEEPRLGSLVDVRVIGVKEDGTLNGSFLPRREERLDDDAQTIFTYLQEVGGEMPFHDRSDPEEIRGMFNMSKGAFKRALGRLMKKGFVEQKDGWTTLIQK